jgi:dolichol-phosphate mannosyltransferase
LESTNETDITKVVILPTYREFETLRKILSEIGPLLWESDCVIISDDTGLQHQSRLISLATAALSDSRARLHFTFSEAKGGRGAAIYRGMDLALTRFPNLEYLVEADSDGSHRVQDIIRVLQSDKSDFVIGSRYLPESRIEGWSQSRRALSYWLNRLIPRILRVDCTDITNGLRRYSKLGAIELINSGQQNTGFIYLSEQAQKLVSAGYPLVEIPTIFVNRTDGESSVGLREITMSLLGVFKLAWKTKFGGSR